MRQDVESLVAQQLKMDEDYFTGMLSKLQAFFSNIQLEYNKALDAADICNICSFKYGIKAKFKKFNQGAAPWSSDYLYCPDDTFSEGLYELNSHMYNQFLQDFSPISTTAPNVNIGSRDYRHILGDGFDTPQAIYDKKMELLREIHRLLGQYSETNNLVDYVFGG